MEIQPKSKTGGRKTLPKQGLKSAHWTAEKLAGKSTWRTRSPLGFCRSRVRGVLGYGSSWFSRSSPEIPWSRRKSSQNSLKIDSRGSGFTGRESLGHGLHGFLTHRAHGLTGDHVAGVLWSRRCHPPEGRALSPSTLPISLLISRLSLSVSSLCLNLPLCSQLPL
jgi:hypothetical protein